MQRLEICLKGHLDRTWIEWLGDFTITWTDKGETLLTGCVSDQAALYGLLGKLRDLGIELVSVQVSRAQTNLLPVLKKPPRRD